jgi:hypothetical protein
LIDEVKQGATWAMDNDCFNGGLDADKFVEILSVYHPYREKCLFVALPDVVGDSQKTLKRFFQWQPIISNFGYKVALVTQDGLTPQKTPWNLLDALFVGGTDNHKRGKEGGALIERAKKIGVWVHVGRVNSASVMENLFWMCDSFDGTTITFNPGERSRSIGGAINRVRAKKKFQLTLF